MEKAFGWLKVEHWYHVFILLGAAGTGAALIFDLKAVTNAHALLLSIGMFFVGMGEWVNHPLQTSFLPPSAYRPGGVVTGHPRHASALGIIFDLIGIALAGVGIFKIVASA